MQKGITYAHTVDIQYPFIQGCLIQVKSQNTKRSTVKCQSSLGIDQRTVIQCILSKQDVGI